MKTMSHEQASINARIRWGKMARVLRYQSGRLVVGVTKLDGMFMEVHGESYFSFEHAFLVADLSEHNSLSLGGGSCAHCADPHRQAGWKTCEERVRLVAKCDAYVSKSGWVEYVVIGTDEVPVTTSSDDAKARERMRDAKVRKLPVLRRSGRLLVDTGRVLYAGMASS